MSGSAGTRYNAATNYYEVMSEGKWISQLDCVFAKIKTDTTSPYKITSFEPYTVDSVANSNASNFSQAGRSYLSGLGMPSGRYIDLTLGASGSTYTAPANGYFYLGKAATAAGQYVDMFNTISKYRLQGQAMSAGSYCLITVPARKGDVVKINYNVAGAIEGFYFIYAEGEN